MPPHFTSVYSPIADPASQNQIQRVARLLSTQLTAAGIGPGAEKTGYIPQQVTINTVIIFKRSN